MGFKAISTRRTSATSAVSNQAVVINTGTGNLSVGGAIIQSNTTITLGVTTPGQSSANSAVAAAGGPTITSFVYLDANNNPTSANAVSTSGGNIKITGSGFASGSSVYINNALVSNTFVSSTQITAICPPASAGNVSLFIFTPTNVGALSGSQVRYSGPPTWTTAAVSFQNGSVANVALVASSDSTLTFTLQDGSSLPTGITLQSAGYLTGTVTGYTVNTTTTAVFIATDAEGQATQQTINITVVVSDPQFPYTTLLLNGDTGSNTANAATNNTFLDSSTNNFSITRSGNTTQGSFTTFSPTGWSNYFGGADSFTTPANAAFGFSTGDFTVEFWINFNSVSGRQDLVWWGVSSSDRGGLLLNITAGNLTYYISPTVANAINYAWVPTVGVWYHIALVRISGSTKLYVNGTQGGSTYSDTKSYSNSNLVTVGKDSGAASSYTNAAITNLRIVKGVGVYTGTFTPPTSPLTATQSSDTNINAITAGQTSLLTCQSSRFLDNSSNAIAISPAGSAKCVAYSLFSPSAAYSTTTVGGSAYFDGTGDYLTGPTGDAAFQFGTGDFTIESWVYIASGAVGTIFDNRTGSTSTHPVLYIGSNTLQYYVAGAGAITAGTVPIGAWMHTALVRISNSTKLYLNGTQVGSTYVDNNNFSTSGAVLTGAGFGGTSLLTGYISDLRVVKGVGVYTGTFTPPTAPLTATQSSGTNISAITAGQTSLLLNFTNGGIVDAHSTNLLETIGNAQLSTVVKKFGSASIAFDGTGDWLTIVDNPSIQMRSGDFTIEGWVYITSLGSARGLVSKGTSTTGLTIGINSSNQLSATYTTTALTGTTALSANTWYHFAIVRYGSSSGNIKIYLNGTLEATSATAITTDFSSTDIMYIGADRAAGSPMIGYMDDVRITKGFARYTANFTVPDAAFAGL